MFNVQFASKAAYSISCTQEHLWFQDEEIEALAAIYGDDWEVVDSESRKYHIRISDEKLKNAILMEVCIKKPTPEALFTNSTSEICMTFMDKTAFTPPPQFSLNFNNNELFQKHFKIF